jgi:hypothetical protein
MIAFALACGPPKQIACDDDDDSLGDIAADADCDGTLTADDCDDGDATINPGAVDGLLVDRDCLDGLDDNSLALSDYSFVGENEGDYAGGKITSAGDVDGDGLDDLLVGAYRNDDGGSDAGKGYLILSGL